MSKNSDFSEQVLGSFRKTRSEIDRDTSEDDVRHRLIKYFVEELLGYRGKDYQAEKHRTDIRLLDETHSLVLVVVETKKPAVAIGEEKWKDEAFGYSDAFTKYVVLTNGLQLMVWEKARRDKPIVDLDFDAILGQKRFTPDGLTVAEKSQLATLWELTRENLWSEKKYEDFTVPEKIDISTDDGFRKLMEKLHFVMNQLLMGYALGAFNEHVQGYKRYQTELRSIEVERKRIKGNRELEAGLEKASRDLEDKNRKFTEFQRGYDEWLKLSSREDGEESKEVFSKETVYVLLNKLLLARICEDKGLVKKKLSNSGIARIRELFTYLKDSYKDLLDFAYRDISQLYSHVFERSIFDWYTEGNGQLNRLLNRVLYVFNHFDFGQVNRDILGKLYEKYLPREERKKLGGFYTPEEVIDYILDAVGYTADEEIEGKDLLDPACGSGGFLVRAVGRLIDRYKMKGLGPKEILNNVISHIYGLDIDPFACHIAEMNLLFQIIDLYQKARKEDASYQLPRFSIYQTDSLETPTIPGTLARWQYPNSRVQKYVQEKETIEKIKTKKFDFVVGNPPYVRKEGISPDYKKVVLRPGFGEIYHGDNDLYVYFIGAGIRWLKDKPEKARLGFIVSRKFTKTRYGSLIRTYVLNNCLVEQYVDFGDTAVFADVTNYPCILILRREPDMVLRDSHVIAAATIKKDMTAGKGLLGHIWMHLASQPYSDEYIELFQTGQSGLRAEWRIAPSNLVDVLTKIERSAGASLKDVADVYYCIKTGANEVLVLDHKKVEELDLEREFLRPVLEGEDVRRYRIIDRKRFLAFPYLKTRTKEGSEYTVADINDFPNLARHLEKHRERLAARSDIRGTRSRWYELRSCDYYRVFESEKIVTPDIALENRFAYDDGKYFCLDTCFAIVAKRSHRALLRYFLGVLNSKTIEFYFRQVSTHVRQRYYRYKREYLEPLPIRLPESRHEERLSQEVVELVDQLLLTNARLNESEEAVKKGFPHLLKGLEVSRLDDYPSVIVSVSSNKLAQVRREGNSVFLNLQDHIECKDDDVAKYVELYLRSTSDELRKSEALRKDICAIMIPTNKNDINRISEHYEDMHKEMSNIPERIKTLESEIDQRVYQLYGLSRDDVRVIEQNLSAETPTE
jgi:type I restriction-modification system DNA methylase subunit